MTASDSITLSAGQSLALREMIAALQQDDSAYGALPATVRGFVATLLMPAYTSAELEILALREESEARLRLLEKFGAKIQDLERAKRGAKVST